MPWDLPGFALNVAVLKLFNSVYYHRIPARGRQRDIDLLSFYYPLDAVGDWNRLYGRAGFTQFQCVVPDTESRRAMPAILSKVAASGIGSFLAVIKTLGRTGRGNLSFSARGTTLALDLRNRPGTAPLLKELHAMTSGHGGRVYLAKDSHLTPAQFPQMYPQLNAFRSVLARVDPGSVMRSDMRVRLGI